MHTTYNEACTWEEAQAAARQRWSEERPEDPWKGKTAKEPIEWTPPTTA